MTEKLPLCAIFQALRGLPASLGPRLRTASRVQWTGAIGENAPNEANCYEIMRIAEIQGTIQVIANSDTLSVLDKAVPIRATCVPVLSRYAAGGAVAPQPKTACTNLSCRCCD
jgi:hypothetical protein